MHRASALVLGAAAATMLSACSSLGASPAPPTWVPSPTFRPGGAEASPIIPIPARPGGPGQGSGSQPPGGGGASPTTPASKPREDPNVVATHLSAPVGLVLMPDGTALVGERTTGRIVRVQPRAGRPTPTVRVLHGLDTSGDGGLLDLALSPTYVEDGLIYAYVTTPTDNRVVDFTLDGPVTAVFTGIPKGRRGNTGRILFGADGDLYVGTGDAGNPALAAKPHSLAGKVLRLDSIGDPAKDNPVPSSPIWTSGHRVVDGLCSVGTTRWIYEVEAGSPDEVNLLGAGTFYGSPRLRSDAVPPVAGLPSEAGGPGGCAVLDRRLWVTSLSGEALLWTPLRPGVLSPTVGGFSTELKHKYGRLRTVVAAPDGALWLTTSNRDGFGKPVPTDERVIRFLPSAGGGHSTM
jgi:glucose/arabinose dehydrogenase